MPRATNSERVARGVSAVRGLAQKLKYLRRIQQLDAVDETFYREANPDLGPLFQTFPALHYVTFGESEGRQPAPSINPADVANIETLLGVTEGDAAGFEALLRKRSMLRSSPLFDRGYYLGHNPDIIPSQLSPEDHYALYGRSEGRNPLPDIDVIWWSTMFEDGRFATDPLDLIDPSEVGPGRTRPRTPVVLDRSVSLGAAPRRAFLVAGYDPDNRIDDYVIDLVAEFSQHGDVFYFADGSMSQHELDKLSPYVKSASSERHRSYDVGSWSRLARDIVGWDTLCGYDEVTFVNDSVYLVKPLGPVIETMAQRDVCWWGLHANKSIVSTVKEQGLDRPIELDAIKANYLTQFESDYAYDFFVASYFLTFRKPVLQDRRFQSLIDNVRPDLSKRQVIRRYEIGITRYLLSQGYDFDAYVPTVFPTIPVFTNTIFDLIEEQDFPFFKRYLLANNHYNVPDLFQWKSRLTKAGVDDASIESIQANVNRVVPNDQLRRTLSIDVRGRLSSRKFEESDPYVPKFDDWWAFPVCGFTHRLDDNTRALFEHVRWDPAIKKVILTRSKAVDLAGPNVEEWPLSSRMGQYYLQRCRQVFLKHSVPTNVRYPLDPVYHNLINLWHGVPLKRIGYLSLDHQHQLDRVAEQNATLAAVISSSEVDQLAMAGAYWPIDAHRVWLTGLPRHDLITADEADLPLEMQDDLNRLRDQLGGRRLVFFVPTFRNAARAEPYLTPQELEAVEAVAAKHDAAIGLRPHMAERDDLFACFGNRALDLSSKNVVMVEMIYRLADVLVTDFSSSYIDYLLTGRPVIQFAKDASEYIEGERGVFYDRSLAVPAPMATTGKELATYLDDALDGQQLVAPDRYEAARKLLIKYTDGRASERVATLVKGLPSAPPSPSEIEDLEEADEIDLLSTTGLRVPMPLVSDEPEVENTDSTKKSALDRIRARTTRDFRGLHITWVLRQRDSWGDDARVFNLVSELDPNTTQVRVVEAGRLHHHPVATNEVLVLSSAYMTDTIADVVVEHRRHGGAVIFDTDDLMFDRTAVVESEHFADEPDPRSVLARSSMLERAARQSDLVLASTKSARDLLTGWGLNARVLDTSIAESLIAAYVSSSSPRPQSETVRVACLASQELANDDLAVCVPAIARLAAEGAAIRLEVPEDAKGVFSGIEGLQLITLPRLTDDALHAHLQYVDISLVPLRPTKFNDGRSPKGLLNAALHRVPTIASPSEPYTSLLDHGGDGYLAAEPEDWYEAIAKLAGSTQLRDTIGAAAYTRFIPRYRAKTVVAELLDLIKALRT